jgi:hypothetical protein
LTSGCIDLISDSQAKAQIFKKAEIVKRFHDLSLKMTDHEGRNMLQKVKKLSLFVLPILMKKSKFSRYHRVY